MKIEERELPTIEEKELPTIEERVVPIEERATPITKPSYIERQKKYLFGYSPKQPEIEANIASEKGLQPKRFEPETALQLGMGLFDYSAPALVTALVGTNPLALAKFGVGMEGLSTLGQLIKSKKEGKSFEYKPLKGESVIEQLLPEGVNLTAKEIAKLTEMMAVGGVVRASDKAILKRMKFKEAPFAPLRSRIAALIKGELPKPINKQIEFDFMKEPLRSAQGQGELFNKGVGDLTGKLKGEGFYTPEQTYTKPLPNAPSLKAKLPVAAQQEWSMIEDNVSRWEKEYTKPITPANLTDFASFVAKKAQEVLKGDKVPIINRLVHRNTGRTGVGGSYYNTTKIIKILQGKSHPLAEGIIKASKERYVKDLVKYGLNEKVAIKVIDRGMNKWISNNERALRDVTIHEVMESYLSQVVGYKGHRRTFKQHVSSGFYDMEQKLYDHMDQVVKQYKIGGLASILPERAPIATTGKQLELFPNIEQTQYGTVSKAFDMQELPELRIPKYVEGRKRRMLSEVGEFVGTSNREKLVREAGDAGNILIYETKEGTIRPAIAAGKLNDDINMAVIKKGPPSTSENANLADVLQGIARPISERVQNLFNVIRRQTNFISALKQQQDPTWKPLSNYYHHELPKLIELKDKRIRLPIIDDMVRRGAVENRWEGEQLINDFIGKVEARGRGDLLKQYLVKTKQAKNIDDASYILNKFISRYRGFAYGAFEPRTLDLPFYNPNVLAVMARYNEDALRSLYLTERFGKNATKLYTLIDKIGEGGGSRDAAKTAVDMFLGNMSQDSVARLTRWLLNAQVVQRMSLSAVGNYFQGLTGGAMRTDIFTSSKALRAVHENAFEARRFAARAGQHPEFKTFFNESAGDIARKALKLYRFTKTEVDNYVNGMMTGKVYAIDQFNALKANPKNVKVRTNLLKLGIDPDLVLKRGSLSENNLLRAGTIVWREGQSIPTVWNQPQKFLGMDLTSTAGKLAFQFKSVAYAQTKLVWDYAIKRAWKGDFSGLLTLALIFPAVGEIIEGIQDTISGKGRPENLWLRYCDDMQGAFAFGMLDDLYYMATTGLTQTGGPTMQQVGEIAQGTMQFIKGKSPTGLKRQLRGIPIVGQALYNAVKGK